MKKTSLKTMAGTAGLLAFALSGAAHGFAEKGVLLEAAAFQDRGGWVLDTQFYQQMGGFYLLAHGMGTPVANASTEVELPHGGAWHLFVRTRNWCPGDWEAPGRFRVLLDGQPLEPVFGTEPGWAWQKGGAIDLAAGKHAVALQDLTGFEGRIDALFFSPVADPKLPLETGDVVAWKDRMAGRDTLDAREGAFDVVVVGGGIAGCGAALAADSQGLKVALIHDRPVLGGNASSEIRVHTLGIHGADTKILKGLDTKHWPNGSSEALADTAKRHRTLDASGVTQFLGWRACGVGMDGRRIASVSARQVESGEIKRFHAPVFIDCTGDGWIGYWAGADFRYGRESRNEFGEGWEKHGERWSPETPDNRVLGSSVLWNSHELDRPSDFPAVPWAQPVSRGHAAINGEWQWEYSDNELHQIDDAEAIRDHLFRAIYGSFSTAKQNPENARIALQWVAYNAGKRESRRLMGDYIYTMQDVVKRREFPDTVVEEMREIDVHYQTALDGNPQDFLSKALFRQTEIYFIPFRSLYSRNIENLMMAGRCFSCSHVGLGGPRVMNTTGQMGIATGYAAALCKKYGATPRTVGAEHIAELRRLIGYGENE